MNNSSSNIYKNARLRSGLKRDPAAEELNIDVRTLDKYESLIGNPPQDIVRKMCDLYNYPYLAWQHIKKTPLGDMLPDLTEDTFQGATLSVVSDINSVNEILNEIVQIACDGKVTADERPAWQRSKKKLIKLTSSLLSLLLSEKGGE